MGFRNEVVRVATAIPILVLPGRTRRLVIGSLRIQAKPSSRKLNRTEILQEF